MLNYILEFIERNQDSVIIVILVAAIQLYIANRFQKNLETHKGEVNSRIEDVKHKQQRIFKEFDLYTTKMHEVYPELYRKMEYANGEVAGLQGLRFVVDLKKFNLEEFIEHLESLDVFSESERSQLSNCFSRNKEEAIAEYHSKMSWVRYNKADKSLTEANNFFIVNELYLSDEAARTSREMLKLLHKYWNALNPEYNNDLDTVRDRRETRDSIDGYKETFRATLKKDLKKSFTD